MTNDTTTTGKIAPGDGTKMVGAISSIRLDDNGDPAWTTAGHWNLESDIPFIGTTGDGSNQTEHQFSSFNATLYMVSSADGSAQHPHQVPDLAQTSVLREGPNSTTVNGTFPATLQEGPVQNVNGYIHIINDKIEFYLDPTATEKHLDQRQLLVWCLVLTGLAT